MMKEIKIFVASSCEFHAERAHLSYLVLKSREEYAKRGFVIVLSKWEDVDPTLTDRRTEDRYLDEMCDCDGVLILLGEKIGNYTKEEFDKAIECERKGSGRIQGHAILFDQRRPLGKDVRSFKTGLSNLEYGSFEDIAGFERYFFEFVDKLAQLGLKTISPCKFSKSVSTCLAFNEGTSKERDEFIDNVMRLGEEWARSGVDFNLRLYSKAEHNQIMRETDFALALYAEKCEPFGKIELLDALERMKRGPRPRRIYLYFNEDPQLKPNDDVRDLKDFIDGELQNFYCHFSNVEALAFNFVLRVQSFCFASQQLRLWGRNVMMGDVKVCDITKLPLVARNEVLMQKLDECDELAGRQKDMYRERQSRNVDAALIVEINRLSQRREELQDEIEKELGRSFTLAQRLASISQEKCGSAIRRAHDLAMVGKLDEAIKTLDKAEPIQEIARIAMRANERERCELEEVESIAEHCTAVITRCELVMARTGVSCQERYGEVCLYLDDVISQIRCCVDRYSCSAQSKLLEGLMNVLNCKIKCAESVDDSKQQIETYLLKLNLIRELGRLEVDRTRDELVCAMEIGMAYRIDHQYQMADKWLQTARELSKRLAADQTAEELDVEAAIANNLGIVNQEREQLDAAMEEYGRAVDLWRKCIDLSSQTKYSCFAARASDHLGMLLRDNGQIEDAERAFAEAEILFETVDRRCPSSVDQDLCILWRNIGILYEKQGKYDLAEENYSKALELIKPLAAENPMRYEEDYACALSDFALLRKKQGRDDEVAKYYNASLTVRRRLASVNHVRYAGFLALLLRNMADFHLEKGMTDQAESEASEALRLCEELVQSDFQSNAYDLSAALFVLGKVFENRDDACRAKAMFERVVEIRKRACGGDDKADSVTKLALDGIVRCDAVKFN